MKKLRWGFVQILGVAIFLVCSAANGVRWEEVEEHAPDGKQLVCLHLPPSGRVDYRSAASNDPRAPKLEERDGAIYLHSIAEPWTEEQLHNVEPYNIYESRSGMTSEGEKAFEELEDFETPGHDRRKPADPSTWPYRTIVCLKLFFEGRDPTRPAVGTGVIIGPHHVLTVGHNIFERNSGTTVEKIEVLSGLDSYGCYFGQQEVVRAYLFKNWKEGAFDSESSYDIALLLLDCSVGSQTGLCGLAAYRGPIPNQPMSLYGYAGIWDNKLNAKLVGMESKRENVTSDEGNILYKKTDSSGGQSGSPLIQTGENESPYAIGVHRAGLSVGNNVGTRLTETLLTSFIFPLLSETWKLDLGKEGTYRDPLCLPGIETDGPVQTCLFNDRIMLLCNTGSPTLISQNGRHWHLHGSGSSPEEVLSARILSLVSFKDRIFQSFDNERGSHIYSSVDEGRTWREEPLPPQARRNLVLSSLNDTLWAIYNSGREDEVFMAQSPDGSTWEAEWSIPSLRTGLPIALAFHHKQWVAAYVQVPEGEEIGDVFLSSSNDGGVTWTEPIQLDGGKTRMSVTLASHKGTLFVVRTGSDLRIHLDFLSKWYESDDSSKKYYWEDPELIQGCRTTQPVSLLPFGKKLLLFHTGVDKKIYCCPYREETLANTLYNMGTMVSQTMIAGVSKSIGTFSFESFESYFPFVPLFDKPGFVDEDGGSSSGPQPLQEVREESNSAALSILPAEDEMEDVD